MRKTKLNTTGCKRGLKNGLKHGFMLFVLSVTLLVACSCFNAKHHPDHDGMVSGSGQLTEEERNVNGFDKIRMFGAAEVIFRPDTKHSLRLVGETNILPLISTEVRGGELIINSDFNYYSRVGIKIYVTMPEIRGFYCAGAAKIIGEEAFVTDTLNLEIVGAGEAQMEVTADAVFSRIVGAGRIDMMGKSKTQRITIIGAGIVDAENLETENAIIDIDGAGECRVWVTTSLDAHIAGAGKIYYKGNPSQVSTQIDGAGKIVKQ